jgi:hypothetical protein
VQFWVLLSIVVLAELIVLPKLSAALISGEVPLNPLGWIGYQELAEVSVDRRRAPQAYWLIVLTLTAFALFLAVLIYAVLFRAVS